MKMKNVRIFKKLITLVLAGVSIVTFSSCDKKTDVEENVSLSFVIEEFKDDTFLDEVFDENNCDVIACTTSESDLFNSILLLESYLKVSEQVNSLNLDEYDVKLDSIETEPIKNLDNYDEDYKEYLNLYLTTENKKELSDENIQLYKSAQKMREYGVLANNWLLTDGYTISEELGKYAVKSIVLEACDYTDVNMIKNIKIEANPEWNVSPERANSNAVTIKVNGETTRLALQENSVANDLINNIFLCQTNDKKEGILNGKYNEARNNILSNTLNYVKMTIPMEYIVNNNEIESVISISDSRKLIKSKIN